MFFHITALKGCENSSFHTCQSVSTNLSPVQIKLSSFKRCSQAMLSSPIVTFSSGCIFICQCPSEEVDAGCRYNVLTWLTGSPKVGITSICTVEAFAVLCYIRLSSLNQLMLQIFFFLIKAACLLNNPSLTSAYLLDLLWAFIILLYFTFSGFLGIFKSISGFWNVLMGVW